MFDELVRSLWQMERGLAWRGVVCGVTPASLLLPLPNVACCSFSSDRFRGGWELEHGPAQLDTHFAENGIVRFQLVTSFQ